LGRVPCMLVSMIRPQRGRTGGANLLSEAGVVKLRLGQLG
jgi:hypothetical protein